jgi:hypothetical protein
MNEKNTFDEIQLHLDENELKNVQSSKSDKQSETFSFFQHSDNINLSYFDYVFQHH